jgi:hypothetical protein
LGAKARSDQITTQFLIRTKDGVSLTHGTKELDEYRSLAKTQQVLFSLKLSDIHLSLINPLVCQMKVLSGRLHSESLGLLPFFSRGNGELCGQDLNGYTHLIECPSHGFRFFLHGKLEDALFQCFRDALRPQITQGAADVVIDDDKRKNARHNLLTSEDRDEGRGINEFELIVDNRSLGEGCQPDGITVYGGRVDRGMFPIVTRGRVTNPRQNLNSLANRVQVFHTFLDYCREFELKVEFWDVHFSQGSFKQLRRNEKNESKKYSDTFSTFIQREDEEFAPARENM